jgi:hypothetical protein
MKVDVNNGVDFRSASTTSGQRGFMCFVLGVVVLRLISLLYTTTVGIRHLQCVFSLLIVNNEFHCCSLTFERKVMATRCKWHMVP